MSDSDPTPPAAFAGRIDAGLQGVQEAAQADAARFRFADRSESAQWPCVGDRGDRAAARVSAGRVGRAGGAGEAQAGEPGAVSIG